MAIDIESVELQKNHLYRDGYRRVLQILLYGVLLSIGLAIVLSYQLLTKSDARYYATTTTGVIIPLQSLSMPVVTNVYLLQWAVLAARSCYNLDFVNYAKQLDAASANFTPAGWQSLTDAMQSSGLINSLKENKLFISAVVDGPAVILAQDVVNNRYTWRVQVPLLITYASANDKKTSHNVVTMDILRVPVIDSSKSIQINNFIVMGRS